MYFDDDDDYSFESDNYVSPLSGQSIYVPGSTHNHWTESVIPSGVTIDLPDGYRLDTEYDDDGNEVNTIRGGFKYDDQGEETSEFSAGFNLKFNVDVTDKKKKEPGHVLHEIADGVVPQVSESIGKATRYDVTSEYPATTIISCYKPFSLFGATIDTFIILLLIEVDQETIFTINTIYQDKDDPNDPFFKHFLTLLKSIKANNKTIKLGRLTPTQLKKHMMLEADDSTEAMQLNASINIDVSDGESTTRTTINSDGSTTESVIEASLKYAFAEDELHPHYNSMLGASGLGMLGVNVIVNSTGTEYHFYQVDDYVSEDASNKVKDAVSKLNDAKADSYKLADKAVEMRGLFHVSKAAFNEQHDRECELAEDLMHRAYMMSAIRSFAWTLAAYCDDMSIKPVDVDLEHIHKIIDFVKDRNWLNYDDVYCKGLCGTQDLHVFYLPDKTPKSVKDVFLPDKKTLDETKKMQEKFPSYNPILQQVGSLDKLRKDLNYIYPAIEKIFNELCERRNPNEPLEGDEADILYAWCALAYAARGPFFSEDGPTSCYFTQMDTDFDLPKGGSKATKTKTEKNIEKKKAASGSKKVSLSKMPVAEVPDNRKKLINGNKKEKYPVRFFYYFETGENWEEDKNVFYYHCEKSRPGFRAATEQLYQKAVRYLDAFADDTKVELQNGLLRDTKPIHALRSFIWTAVEANGLKDKQSFGELSQEDLTKLLGFLDKHNLANYKPVTSSSQRFGGLFLRKEEVKSSCSTTGGNSINRNFIDGFENAYIKASGMNLVDLSYDLEGLLPSMEEIYSILSGNCNDDIRQAAEAVLKGWCIYALHCRASFCSMPAKYAPDIKERSDIHDHIETNIKPKYLDENRYTVIDDTVVDMNDNRDRVIIPEGVKYIVTGKPMIDLLNKASEAVFPESYEGVIEIPSNLRKLIVKSNAKELSVNAPADPWKEDFALSEVQFSGSIKTLYRGFSWCHNLRKVILPDSLEVIPFYMFHSCEALKNIQLPHHLKEIQRNAFSETGISTLTLPLGVESIGEDAFDDQNSSFTVNVYKDSRSEKALQEYCNSQRAKYADENQKYGTHYAIKMRIEKLDSPWERTAKDFVDRIERLYDFPEESEKMKADISGMIDSTFSIEFEQVRDSVINIAEGKKLATLCNILKDSNDKSILKDKLPEVLANEIPEEARQRAYEKKHTALTLNIQSTKDRISQLRQSISDNDKKLCGLQNRMSNTEENLKAKHEAYDAMLEDKRVEWLKKSNEIQEEISDSRMYLEKLQEQIKNRTNELGQLSFLQFGKKKELNQIIDGLNKEIENEKTKRDQLVQKREAVDKEYHSIVDVSKKEINDLAAALPGLKEQLNTVKNRVEKEQLELNEKTEALAALEKELEGLKVE